MMTRFEGDVVNSLYDTFLISWHSKLDTEWPCLQREAVARRDFVFGPSVGDATAAAQNGQQHMTINRHTNSQDDLSSLMSQLTTDRTSYTNQDHPQASISVNERLNVEEHIEQTAAAELADEFRPFMFHPKHEPVPMALVNRQPHNMPGYVLPLCLEGALIPTDTATYGIRKTMLGWLL